MQERIDYREIPFNKIPIEESKDSRQEFLEATQKEKIEVEWDLFYQKLQAEADKKFPGQEKNSLKRDLWLNLQIVLAYMEAEMWSEANEALDDALIVATHAETGEDIFNSIRDKIPNMTEKMTSEEYSRLAQEAGPHSSSGKFYQKKGREIKIDAENKELFEELKQEFEQKLSIYHQAIEEYKQKYLDLSKQPDEIRKKLDFKDSDQVEDLFKNVLQIASKFLNSKLPESKQIVNDNIFSDYDEILKLAKTTSFVSTAFDKTRIEAGPILHPFYNLARSLANSGAKNGIPGFEKKLAELERDRINKFLSGDLIGSEEPYFQEQFLNGAWWIVHDLASFKYPKELNDRPEFVTKGLIEVAKARIKNFEKLTKNQTSEEASNLSSLIEGRISLASKMARTVEEETGQKILKSRWELFKGDLRATFGEEPKDSFTLLKK